MPEPFSSKEISAYPFYGSSARVTTIHARYKEVATGMTAARVKSILGEPDEVKPAFEARIWNAKQIGYIYLFVIRRLVKNGSANDRQESLVRVTFDLNGQVTKVHQWGSW
jgi:outer membrane protein assembly factor BamE (lipoprotein component of BamABCDE complex)